MCESNMCSIRECQLDEVPVFWRKSMIQVQPGSNFDIHSKSISKECPKDTDEWCAVEEYDPEAIFVNLEKNKESYTAFEGMQVWKAIY